MTVILYKFTLKVLPNKEIMLKDFFNIQKPKMELYEAFALEYFELFCDMIFV